MSLQQPHFQEWLDSGVHPDLISLNVKPIAGKHVFDDFYPNRKRCNGGRLTYESLRIAYRYEDLSGWMVDGVDPRTGQPLGRGRFKPTVGEILDKSGKPMKYVSPPGLESPLIYLRTTELIWQRVSERSGIPMPDNYLVNNLTGETPGFWPWVLENNVPLHPTEGEKKAGSLLTQGYASPSIPGIWNGRRNPKGIDGKPIGKPYLVDDLKIFNTPGRGLIFWYDYDATPEKRQTTLNAAVATGVLFENASVRIALLPGPQKGVDDFIMAGGDFEQVLKQARTLSSLLSQEQWKFSLPVDHAINQRYLEQLPLPKSGLVFLKSAKGTGKTTALEPIISGAAGTGQRSLLLTHRVALGKAICEAVGLPYITEADSVEQKRSLGYGLCIDSCHPGGKGRIRPEDWAGAILILDEAEQVIKHLLSSTTCQRKRVLILRTFKALLRYVLSTGGLVIVQDADLSDLSVEFLLGQLNFAVTPWVCVNSWRPEQGWEVNFYDVAKEDGKDNPAALLASAVAEIKNGGKIWLQSDSQKPSSPYGTQNLERYLVKLFPDKKVIRIDSETIGNPGHEAFGCAENLNKVVGEKDIVIASPTLATGVSVDIRGHFTGVYGIFQGTTPVNEALQSLARVREDIPRHVWVRKCAVVKIGDGSSNYKQILKSVSKNVKDNCRLLRDADFDLDIDFDLDTAHNPIALKTYAKMAARDNGAVRSYRDTLRDGLIEEGHNVRRVSESSPQVAEEIQQIKKAAIEEEAAAVAAAKDIDDGEYARLKDKRSRTDSERLSERNYTLKKRYEVPVTPELYKLDADGWYSQLLLHYLLTVDPEIVKFRDCRHLKGHIDRGEGEVCPQDLRMWTTRVETFRSLGVLDLALSNKKLSADSPEILELMAKILKYRKSIEIAIGVKISETLVRKSPMRVLQDLLGYAGISLAGGKQQRCDDGKKRRFYRGYQWKSKIEREMPPPIDGETGIREVIFARWEVADWNAINEQNSEPVEIGTNPFLYPKLRREKITSTPLGVAQHHKEENVSNFDTKMSHHSYKELINISAETSKHTPRIKQEAVEQPAEAPFKQGSIVRRIGKEGRFMVAWCGIDIAAVKDSESGKAFNLPTADLVADGGLAV